MRQPRARCRRKSVGIRAATDGMGLRRHVEDTCRRWNGGEQLFETPPVCTARCEREARKRSAGGEGGGVVHSVDRSASFGRFLPGFAAAGPSAGNNCSEAGRAREPRARAAGEPISAVCHGSFGAAERAGFIFSAGRGCPNRRAYCVRSRVGKAFSRGHTAHWERLPGRPGFAGSRSNQLRIRYPEISVNAGIRGEES